MHEHLLSSVCLCVCLLRPLSFLSLTLSFKASCEKSFSNYYQLSFKVVFFLHSRNWANRTIKHRTATNFSPVIMGRRKQKRCSEPATMTECHVCGLHNPCYTGSDAKIRVVGSEIKSGLFKNIFTRHGLNTQADVRICKACSRKYFGCSRKHSCTYQEQFFRRARDAEIIGELALGATWGCINGHTSEHVGYT